MQSKMDILIKEIMTSIEVLQFQLVVMTGTTANIEAPGGETEKPILMTGGSPMTTKRPGNEITDYLEYHLHQFVLGRNDNDYRRFWYDNRKSNDEEQSG